MFGSGSVDCSRKLTDPVILKIHALGNNCESLYPQPQRVLHPELAICQCALTVQEYVLMAEKVVLTAVKLILRFVKDLGAISSAIQRSTLRVSQESKAAIRRSDHARQVVIGPL